MKLFNKTTYTTNNTLSLVLFLLMITPLFSAYRGPVVKADENNSAADFASSSPITGERYVIYIKESVVTWKCVMALTNKGGHSGYISVKKGELMIEKGQLVGGVVEVDMNTIADEHNDRDNDLVRHLKDPDFFDVKKFPVTTFAITKVAPAEGGDINVTGKLTIKGIIQDVTFPAKLEEVNGIIHANGKVTIDRTKWDVRYGSGKFFDNLADDTISDNIEFEMKIVAKKD
jgi:polyisoprenoid-binding protein YceI